MVDSLSVEDYAKNEQKYEDGDHNCGNRDCRRCRKLYPTEENYVHDEEEDWDGVG